MRGGQLWLRSTIGGGRLIPSAAIDNTGHESSQVEHLEWFVTFRPVRSVIRVRTGADRRAKVSRRGHSNNSLTPRHTHDPIENLHSPLSLIVNY